MNLPNWITIARITACPVLAVLVWLDPLWARATAFVLFLVAAFSDLIDGVLARRGRRITRFGKLADPVADKVLVAATLVPLAALGVVPVWVAAVVLGRELAITLFRRFALSRGRVISASPLGKAKTLSQNWLVGTALFGRILERATGAGAAGARESLMQRIVDSGVTALVWITLVLTVLSLVDYLYRNRTLAARRAA